MKQLGLILEPEAAPRRRRSAVLRSFHISSPGGHASVPEALEGERKAQRQEQAILSWMGGYGMPRDWRYTPSDVAGHFPQWPLTSIRRALSTMTAKGLLQHHKADRRPGPLGAKESCWSLA